MNFLVSLLSEKSAISCVRVMSLLSLCIGGAIAFMSIFNQCSLQDATPLVSVFVAGAFGGKVGQKFAEQRGKK